LVIMQNCPPGPASPLSKVAWRPLLVLVGVLALVQIVAAGRYGYHRDELYFVAAGQRPAWGYPDQPPLTPLLAAAAQAVAPGSVTVLRLWAVLAMGVVTLVAGLTARELGGGRFAQLLAALAVGLGAVVLLAGHVLATSTIDVCVWVVVSWLVVRALRTRQDWLWLVAGVVLGVGLMNKQLPVFLAAGIGVGILLTPSARPVLRSPWLRCGLLVAAVAWAPVLAWQAAHGWPQLTLAGQIRAEYGTADERLGFVVLQFLLFSLAATGLWVLGLVRLFRHPDWAWARVLAWVWVVVMLAFIVTAGQVYYPVGLYPALIAAGAVVVERRYTRRWPFVAAVVVTSAVVAPAFLPVLPPAVLDRSGWSGLGEQQREMLGWPQLVDQVAAAYRLLPPEQRERAVVFTSNYGEAGAVELFGPAQGLPTVYSGHNGFGLWGPPPQGAGPVVVVWEGETPSRVFTRCRFVSKVTGPVHNEKTEYASIYLCVELIGGWRQAWPKLMHLSA
jgi:4-amino-4-deoxy-L-arabinose transferase-like glycosyltransferase